jgi:hypothetical protein
MKIHITEALRLKNEISALVRTLEYQAKTNIVMGKTYEDNILASEGDGLDFVATIQKLERALDISEELNNKLADFNRANHIDAMVRKMNNLKLLKSIHESLLPKSKATKNTTWVAVGDTRKQVVREYRPLHNASEIKEKINSYKQQIRELQSKVEKINLKFIELTFEHADIDALSVD